MAESEPGWFRARWQHLLAVLGALTASMAASLWFGQDFHYGLGAALAAYFLGCVYLPLSVGALAHDVRFLPDSAAIPLTVLWGIAVVVCCDQLVRKRRWAFAPAVFLLLLIPTPALPRFFMASMGV